MGKGGTVMSCSGIRGSTYRARLCGHRCWGHLCWGGYRWRRWGFHLVRHELEDHAPIRDCAAVLRVAVIRRGRIALVNNTVDIPLAPITIDGVGDGLVLALIGCRPAGEVRELAVVLLLGAAVGLTEPEDRADHVLTEFLAVGDGGEALDDDGGGWARGC